jgi:hypothetical protein
MVKLEGKMRVVINPGSGEVENANEENATENIKQFVKDCIEQSGITDIHWSRYKAGDDKGRFCFEIYRRNWPFIWRKIAVHTIDMPGLPIEKVRYIDEKTQNIWHFPRLYVDGSSWVWKFAILKRKENWIPDKEGIVEA